MPDDLESDGDITASAAYIVMAISVNDINESAAEIGADACLCPMVSRVMAMPMDVLHR